MVGGVCLRGWMDPSSFLASGETTPEMIEKELAPFQPRPNWGKLFSFTAAQLHTRYERLPEFVELSGRYDPKGKFRNEHLHLLEILTPYDEASSRHFAYLIDSYL